MNTRFTQRFLISALVLGCGSIPASAALLTFCVPGPFCSEASNSTASADFTAATTADTFSNIAVTQGSLGTTYTDLGLEFSDPVGMNGSTTPPSGWPTSPTGNTIAGNSTGTGTTLTITLPTSVNAIEFYAGMQNFSNFTISVTDHSGGSFSSGYFGQTTLTAPLFFGVTTDSYFTSFSITSQTAADKITLDDISVGQGAAETPEVATLLLVATGLLLMGYAGRRMQIQAARRGTVRTMSTGITLA